MDFSKLRPGNAGKLILEGDTGGAASSFEGAFMGEKENFLQPK